MSDRVNRLQLSRQEIDGTRRRLCAAHPEVLAAAMASAASDYAALAVARGLRDIAAALLDDGDPAPPNGPGAGWCGRDARLEDRAL